MACNVVCTTNGSMLMNFYCAITNAIFCNGVTIILALILIASGYWLYDHFKKQNKIPF